ncbi:MAG: hypothetical protein G8345_01525 [Magnetococcales bacterium]|nr:hypothetical protein [Magnetococcales bacterium]NGZ25550.1 hypothetical protein [Magnetococcales bacterium]
MSPIRHKLSMLLFLLLTACSTVPEQPVEQGMAVERFMAYQRSWYQTPRHWLVNGIMEVESPETGGRRHRVTLVGEGTRRVRMTIWGPFQQQVGELWLDESQISLIHKQQHEVWQTAATAAGLFRLAQLRVAPQQLVQAVLALSSLSELVPGEGGWFSLGEEKIRLDQQGRLLVREGQQSDYPYTIIYQWPALEAIMPGKVGLTLGDAHKLEFTWQDWRFPDRKSGEEMLVFQPPETFRRIILPEYGEAYALP